MQSLMDAQVRLSEVFVNKLVREFSEGTRYEKQFTVILAGDDKLIIRTAIPMYDIDEITLHFDFINHNQQETNIQFQVGKVITKNILLKPLIAVMKSKLSSWLLEKIGSGRLPAGVNIAVNGEKVQLEIRKFLQKSRVGTLEYPILGRLIDTVEVVSVKIGQGEVLVVTKAVA